MGKGSRFQGWGDRGRNCSLGTADFGTTDGKRPELLPTKSMGLLQLNGFDEVVIQETTFGIGEGHGISIVLMEAISRIMDLDLGLTAGRSATGALPVPGLAERTDVGGSASSTPGAEK
jgi:hypothetical protein